MKMSLSVQQTYKMFSRVNFPDIAKEMLAEMWKYAKKKLFYDVILIASDDEKKITAHRAVLAAANEFFRTMFCSDFKEADEKEVTICGVSGDILESLIQYCYTGVIEINEENVQLLLPQASFMLFPEIVEACSLFQAASINSGNCLTMAKCAKLYNSQALLQSAEEHMKINFLNVTLTEEFLKLNQNELEEYLSFDNLNVDSEKEVFQALMHWIDYNVETRSCALSKLLSLIRLQCIDNKYLLEYVLNSVRKEYHVLLVDGIKQHLSNTLTISERIGIKPNRIIVVCTKKIQIYCPSKNVVEFTYEIPDDVYFSPALVGEKIMLIGEDKVRCFHLNKKSLHDLESTLTKRSCSSVATLNDYVYAIGGWQNGQSLNTVERWHSKLNKWSYVASMNYPRCNHCTAIYNGKIYAIGGYANNLFLNSVECYDPSINKWLVCSPMPTAREFARVVFTNEELIVFGGKGKNLHTLNCIEQYNPETNTWIKVSSMACKRRRFGAYMFNKTIYLFGGHDGDEWITSMEEFDPNTTACKLINNPNIECVKDLYCFPYMSKNK